MGLKCDIPEAERKVTPKQGEALATELGCPFVEASTLANINIDRIFTELAVEMWKHWRALLGSY